MGTETWSQLTNTEKAIGQQILASEERNPKENGYENHSQGSYKES